MTHNSVPKRHVSYYYNMRKVGSEHIASMCFFESSEDGVGVYTKTHTYIYVCMYLLICKCVRQGIYDRRARYPLDDVCCMFVLLHCRRQYTVGI